MTTDNFVGIDVQAELQMKTGSPILPGYMPPGRLTNPRNRVRQLRHLSNEQQCSSTMPDDQEARPSFQSLHQGSRQPTPASRKRRQEVIQLRPPTLLLQQTSRLGPRHWCIKVGSLRQRPQSSLRAKHSNITHTLAPRFRSFLTRASMHTRKQLFHGRYNARIPLLNTKAAQARCPRDLWPASLTSTHPRASAAIQTQAHPRVRRTTQVHSRNT